ncbi:tyrosine-type recombinase/integrase [Neoroseomonas soli]|nr:site-specific integrase [Neoroseomonas soli]
MVREKLAPGRYGDGLGLILQVHPNFRSWLFKFVRGGKARTVGLGATHTTTLAQARASAAECRHMLLRGVDPQQHFRALRAPQEIAPALGFAEAARQFQEAHASRWSERTAAQWKASLDDLAFSARGVDRVGTDDVLATVQPIWTARPASADRLRRRIEAVLAYAIARGWMPGPNPARWVGHISNLLPPRPRQITKHHAALPWPQLPALWQKLAADEATAAFCLRFAILTATRMTEARAARWEELDADTWTIPGERTKTRRPHRVPLSLQAVALLAVLRARSDGEFVFPGGIGGNCLSGSAMQKLLRRRGWSSFTVHGTARSSFRDWIAENQIASHEVAEAALAHVTRSRVVAAYRRTDFLDARRSLMAAWGQFLEGAV